MPDPAEVMTAADLTQHLSRLRERGPAARPTSRVGLTRLARLAGIPRSTLHTYVSGHTFPPAEALDAIVLALGCSPPQARAWAAAWERVASTSRGDLTASRSPYWSTLQRLNRGVSDWVQQTVQRRREDFDTIAIAEKGRVGRNRLIASVEMQITARARRAGADRWFVVVPRSPDLPYPELVDAQALDQCVIGAHRFYEPGAATVVELELGHGIEEGDVCVFAFRIDHGRAAGRAVAQPGQAGLVASTSLERGFAQQGPTYSLRVDFAEPSAISGIEQIYRAGPDAPTERVRSLRLDSWRCATVALEKPSAGLHGIGWTWRSG